MATTLESHGLYIDGEWVNASSDEELEVINPASEEVITKVPQASMEDVDRAVAAARRAFEDGPWPRMSARERSDTLLRFTQTIADRRGELVDMIIAEAGAARSIAEAFQFDTPLRYAFWFAERAATFPYEDPLPPQLTARGLGQGVIRKEPVGVVAAITAFNYPMYLNLAKVVPALAVGNSVVLKPSPYTPLEALVLGEIADAAELPPGVLNVVTGGVPESERLTTHPEVDMVSFTGSDVVGKQIMKQAAGGLKKVLLELGGKSPNIVFAGSDVRRFAAAAAYAFTIHAGQGCALPTRILAERSVYDEVVEGLEAALAKVEVGDPAEPTVTMGPLIRETQRERVERYVANGTAEGARLACGGGRPAHLSRGFFVEPTLFGRTNSPSRCGRGPSRSTGAAAGPARGAPSAATSSQASVESSAITACSSSPSSRPSPGRRDGRDGTRAVPRGAALLAAGAHAARRRCRGDVRGRRTAPGVAADAPLRTMGRHPLAR